MNVTCPHLSTSADSCGTVATPTHTNGATMDRPTTDDPAQQYRAFTDESEDASGDGIVYADESEYAYDFYEN